MIRIKCLTGPFAGRVREFLGTRLIDPRTGEAGEEINPHSLFASFRLHKWSWEVDYSEATQEETVAWFRADLAARSLRALERGLPVKFMGREYRVGPGESVLEVAGRLEDAIVSSGRMITLDADDEENGVVIGVRGWEQ